MFEEKFLDSAHVQEERAQNTTWSIIEGEIETEPECEEGSMQDAVSLCRNTFPSEIGEDWVDACAIDVCSGGKSMANRTVVLAAQAEQVVEEESQMAAGSCHTCEPDDLCSKDVKWALEHAS